MKMKAAVCNAPEQPLDIEEVEIISPRPGEVLVKVDATAVCRSDLHVMEPNFPAMRPGIPGHETAGHVVEVGEGVNRIKVGDYVAATTTTVGCGFCDNCLAGRRVDCTNHSVMAAMMKEPGIFNSEGKPLATQAGAVGGFAEYALVNEYQLVAIPEDMPADKACILSCGVASGFGSVLTAGVQPFSSSLIIGTGGVGINAIQGSCIMGACPVIAMDILDNRLEAAKHFGANALINSSKVEDPVQAVKDLTEGKGADYVFITVTTTSNNLIKQAIEMSSSYGVICKVAFGEMTREEAEDIEWMRPLAGMGLSRKFISPMIGGSNIIRDIPNYVNLYKAGRLNLDDLVSGHYPLDRINEAIGKLETGEALRGIIMM